MATNSATLIMKSGRSVVLTSPFIIGNSVAGDFAGRTRFFNDEDIEIVIDHKA